MHNKEIVKRSLVFFITVMISSIAYYFSTGIYSCWMLTWLAPIPLLLYVLEAGTVPAGAASFVTYFIGFSSMIIAYANTLIPMRMLILLVFDNSINALLFTVLIMLFRYMARQKKHWVWSFAFASGWTAFEFISSLHSPAGTFDSIAYTQVLNLPVIQIASLTGSWGVTFLLMLIPASLALAWYYRDTSKLCLKTIVVPMSILIFTTMFGLYHLHMQAQGPSVKIGMASISMSREELLRSREQEQAAKKIIDRYVHCVELLSRSGAQVILLPETIISLNPEQQPELLQRLADAARQYQVTLITGLSIQEEAKLYNSAYVFLPSGEVALKYNKQHLLQVFEGRYIPGREVGIMTSEDKGIWGIAICKDMDFEEPSREYSQRGVNLLFVPALDFKADEWLHARIAIMRGIEENYAIARAAQWGLLTLTSNKGNIIGMISNATEQGDTLLVGEITLDRGTSLYGRMGNWFAYLSEALFIILLLIFIFKKRKQ
ncbi:MAG: Nitrilase/cyanide hydratase and apolipoprotein N-acyltransferase [Firmicutes bacterium]|nr:Nitrilase/cyanide hydratase and apolipoprotein N-acyltransferase [Bacillota bacterium]